MHTCGQATREKRQGAIDMTGEESLTKSINDRSQSDGTSSVKQLGKNTIRYGLHVRFPAALSLHFTTTQISFHLSAFLCICLSCARALSLRRCAPSPVKRLARGLQLCRFPRLTPVGAYIHPNHRPSPTTQRVPLNRNRLIVRGHRGAVRWR